MPFLELRNVSKSYGKGTARTPVLCDVYLEVEEGEFVAVVGFSGAGKTTLLSMIAGLLEPDHGSILLDGRPIRGPGPDRGVVFQNYSLLPWKSVFGNIYLAVDRVCANLSHEEKVARTEHYIGLVNLTPARDKKPAELSGGMRQRVALARAMATDPRVLLMDEPLSALDALTRANLQDEMAGLCANGGKTMLLITNDVDEALLLADRIVPLSAGPGATLGPPVTVDLPRPRNRKAINHDPRFQRARREVIDYLLNSRRPSRPAAAGARGALTGVA